MSLFFLFKYLQALYMSAKRGDEWKEEERKGGVADAAEEEPQWRETRRGYTQKKNKERGGLCVLSMRLYIRQRPHSSSKRGRWARRIRDLTISDSYWLPSYAIWNRCVGWTWWTLFSFFHHQTLFHSCGALFFLSKERRLKRRSGSLDFTIPWDHASTCSSQPHPLC